MQESPDPARNPLLRRGPGKQEKRAAPVTWPAFPTVNKAINFISETETHPDRYPAAPAEYNSSCRLIRRTSTGQCELWAFSSTGTLAPWSRGILPMATHTGLVLTLSSPLLDPRTTTSATI